MTNWSTIVLQILSSRTERGMSGGSIWGKEADYKHFSMKNSGYMSTGWSAHLRTSLRTSLRTALTVTERITEQSTHTVLPYQFVQQHVVPSGCVYSCAVGWRVSDADSESRGPPERRTVEEEERKRGRWLEAAGRTLCLAWRRDFITVRSKVRKFEASRGDFQLYMSQFVSSLKHEALLLRQWVGLIICYPRVGLWGSRSVILTWKAAGHSRTKSFTKILKMF